MGRVWVCILLLNSDTVQPYGRTKADTRPEGVGLRKKPKDLCISEREDRDHGKGGDVYATLLQSDTLKSNGVSGWRTKKKGWRTKKRTLQNGQDRASVSDGGCGGD